MFEIKLISEGENLVIKRFTATSVEKREQQALFKIELMEMELRKITPNLINTILFYKYDVSFAQKIRHIMHLF